MPVILDRDYGIAALADYIGKTVHVSVSTESYSLGFSGKLSKHDLGWMVNDGAKGVAIFSEESVKSFKFVFRGAYDEIVLST